MALFRNLRSVYIYIYIFVYFSIHIYICPEREGKTIAFSFELISVRSYMKELGQ